MNNKINPDIFYNERFPRSNKYDPAWILENKMGLNPLWLTEFLVQSLDLKPGMRVLDLACGKGMTSIFLAREYGVQVYAVDFDQWGSSAEIRWGNAKEHEVEHLITPIQADAKNLPFAPEFFDAIVCVNSYTYFGQDETYLEYILKFLRPDGRLAVINNGYVKEITDGIPEHILEYLGDDIWSWRTLSWWKQLWEKDGLMSIDVADTLPNGCALELSFAKLELEYGDSPWGDETHIFEADLENGEYMGYSRLIATKK